MEHQRITVKWLLNQDFDNFLYIFMKKIVSDSVWDGLKKDPVVIILRQKKIFRNQKRAQIQNFIEDKISFTTLVHTLWDKFLEMEEKDLFAEVKIVDLILFVKFFQGKLLLRDEYT